MTELNRSSEKANKAVENRLWLIWALSGLSLCVLATALGLLQSKLLYGVIPLLLALYAATYFVQNGDHKECLSATALFGNKVLGILLLLAGVSVLAGGVLTFTAMNNLPALDRILSLVLAICGLLGGALTVAAGANYLSPAAGDKIYAPLLVPVLWYGMDALVHFKNYSTILNTPWQMLHVFSLLCAMMFWLEMAHSFSGTARKKKTVPLVFFCVAGQWVYLISNLFVRWTGFETGTVTEYAAAVLSMAFAVVLWKGRKTV